MTTGTQNLADPTGRQVSGVTQTFLDGYDPATDDRDVGILELSTPTTAPAIQLATSSASLYAGDGVVIAGWGLSNPSNQNIPNALQYASTVVQQPGFCATNAGSNFAFDPATELCTLDAPYGDNSVCFGDSGGPVIANDLQGEPGTPTEIGVIDSTIDCGTSSPDFYARTDVFPAVGRPAYCQPHPTCVHRSHRVAHEIKDGAGHLSACLRQDRCSDRARRRLWSTLPQRQANRSGVRPRVEDAHFLRDILDFWTQ